MECYHCAPIHPELTSVLPEFASGYAAQYHVGHGAAFADRVAGFTVDGSPGFGRLPKVTDGQDLSRSVELFDRVNQQDFAACERTQPSMNSRAYRDGGILVPSEHHIADFHAWVRDRLAEASGLGQCCAGETVPGGGEVADELHPGAGRGGPGL